jgi:hypothetical protein
MGALQDYVNEGETDKIPAPEFFIESLELVHGDLEP